MEQSIKTIISKELRQVFTNLSIDEALDLYEKVAKMDSTAETSIRNTWLENISDFYSFSESIESNYNGDYHRVYIGEIVKTYIAE